jgi:hypothetical protein
MTKDEMRDFLIANGINVQAIGHRRGLYIADFYNKRMNKPVDCAASWWAEIKRVLPDAGLVDTHDTLAEHKPGKPVVWAVVTFRLPEMD